MRLAYPLLAAAALGQSGCSALVAGSGARLDEYTARGQLHDTFGPPVAVAERSEGGAVEEFRTRRKISEGWKGIYICMFDALTLGFGEVYLFPREAGIAAWRSIRGQTLRVEFDAAGHVLNIRHDGEVAFGTTHRYDEPPQTPPAGEYAAGSGTRAAASGVARFRPKHFSGVATSR